MEGIDLEQEKKDILNAYRGLLRSWKKAHTAEDTRLVRKAFNVALDAHSDMRRKSGEPYIYHPIAVARICAEEIGLGKTSIICALLHDTVEDTDIALEDIESMFGKKVMTIIDGLTKMSVFDGATSMQAENFRKVLLTLSNDVRVILIKIADRLHNMRTLDSMKQEKQWKIASETQFLYAPLAHRLGLYSIKSELEDLSLKFIQPEVYEQINRKLQKTKEVRNRFIRSFTSPIKKSLDSEGLNYTIKGRTKSISSIWSKIQNKNVPFEEVYDVFAIRIIVDSPPETEKADCWKVYSIVTDYYQPNPDRLRDWISIPKANGYESLHTTVMSPTGQWVEVQIRTSRMDELAEKGYASHFRYKEHNKLDTKLDAWLGEIRDLLENPESNALEFIDEFKLNLFTDEIYIFTPKGELKILPKGATALDFAFDIHTKVGETCIGAKVNNKLVPLSHELKSGDQIEILTSKKQTPKEDWLQYVVTARARQKIKYALKEEKRQFAELGKETLMRKLQHYNAHFNSQNNSTLEKFYKVPSTLELYYRIAKGSIDLSLIKSLDVTGGIITIPNKLQEGKAKPSESEKSDSTPNKSDTLIIGEQFNDMDYTLAKCCSPIPGDKVFGFITVSDGIKVHRQNCPNAQQLLSKYAYRVIRARWKGEEISEFTAKLKFDGIDNVGIVRNVTGIVSEAMNINMRSISFESKDGTFHGQIEVLVYGTDHLDELIRNLEQVNGINSVEREIGFISTE